MIDSNIKPGQIWQSTSAIEVWKEPFIHHTSTNSILHILVLNTPQTMMNDDSLVRGLVISNESEWGFFNEDEISFSFNEKTYYAHLWLNFPISTSQLCTHIGEIDSFTLSMIKQSNRIFQLGKDVLSHENIGPKLDDNDIVFQQAIDMLFNKSKILNCNAFTRLAKHELLSFSIITDHQVSNLMAAASVDPDRKRFVQAFHNPNKDIIIQIRESLETPEIWEIDVIKDPLHLLDHAVIHSSSDMDSIQIIDGFVQFKRPEPNEIFIRLKSGEFIPFEKYINS